MLSSVELRAKAIRMREKADCQMDWGAAEACRELADSYDEMAEHRETSGGPWRPKKCPPAATD